MGLGVLISLLVCHGAENPTPSGLSGCLSPEAVGEADEGLAGRAWNHAPQYASGRVLPVAPWGSRCQGHTRSERREANPRGQCCQAA